VITNIPENWTTDDVEKMLSAAGILGFFDHGGIITSVKAGASKPNPGIYEFAAKSGVQTSECLFIDDETSDVGRLWSRHERDSQGCARKARCNLARQRL
jgi:FMN phosphatase YigB (HAD superfamily)